MANTTNLNIRMDKTLRDEFESFCSEVGMSITTAVCLFARKTVTEGRIPFEISVPRPNAETRAALDEVRRMKEHPEEYKGYKDVDALFEDLLA